MRALLITAAATVTLVGLAGCGQDVDPAQGQPPLSTSSTPAEAPSVTPPPTKSPELPVDPTKAPAPPSAPVSISPTGPVVPPGVTQVPATQVDVSAVPDYYDHRGLVFAYDEGRSLQAFAMASSGCAEAEARLTEQTATDVRIELRALAQAQGGSPDSKMCTTVLTPRPVTVTLDAPLGDRTVHLSAGR
jgi:hypothetical protein